MGYNYTIIQVVYWVELPNKGDSARFFILFFENLDLDKWDTTVGHRVTSNSQEFCGLTGCQLDPRIWASQLSTLIRGWASFF